MRSKKQRYNKWDDKQYLNKRRTRKIRFFQLFLTVSILALSVRVVYIKAKYGDQYERSAVLQPITNSVDKIINPNRGAIYDRNNQALAVSTTVYRIILDPAKLVEHPESTQKATLQAIHDTIGIDMATLEEYIKVDPETKKAIENTNYKIIARQVPMTQANELKSKNAKCVYLEEDSKRSYIYDDLASHVLGFIRGDSYWGLENKYNDEMTGVPGRLFRSYNADGEAVTEQIPAEEGYSLVTTLDINMQKIAENAVRFAAETYNPDNASMIIMNPKTGEILGMALYPSFNVNDPANPEDVNVEGFSENWEDLSMDEQMKKLNGVWGNYNVSSTFEPGSIFKPMVIAAALEEKVIQTNQWFECYGRKYFHNVEDPVRCWIYPNTHGNQSVVDILANSCNVAMMDIVDLMGRDVFYKYQKDFGFGEKTGIDLPGEISASRLLYSLVELSPFQLATSSFGQGFNCTPIQAVNAFAAVINGGNLMQPYVVAQVVDKDQNVIYEREPEVIRKVISRETSDFLRTAMQKVVTPEGTGKRAYIEGYSIGGKTGTAQVGNRDDNEHTLTFLGYLPVEDPEILVFALINRPEKTEDEVGGGASVGPMLRQALIDIIEYKGYQPTLDEDGTQNYAYANSITLDDYTGQTLSEAAVNLNKIGLEYKVVGAKGNTVISQRPPAGTLVDKDAKIYLTIQMDDSTGTETTIIPDVTNIPLEQAYEMLTDAGLGYTVSRPPKVNLNEEEEDEDDTFNEIVVQQIPEAGIEVAKDLEVKLTIEYE